MTVRCFHVCLIQGISRIFWADSADSRAHLQDLLELAGFDKLINAKGSRDHPLSEEAKAHNRIKSSIRARIEHVFWGIQLSVGGKLTRKAGLS